MLTKYAFFSGTLKPDCEAEMRAYVEETLAPLWRLFQPSEQVRILYNVQQDNQGPTIPLALAVTYKDQNAIDKAMKTDARHEARALMPEFYERFFTKVHLWHYVFEH